MKYLIISFSIVFINVAKCQPSANIITPTEYENIEVNNVKLIDILNSQGDQNNVENLFGTPDRIEKDDDPIYEGKIFAIDFYYAGLDLSFYEKVLSSFSITNNKFNITIKGKTITIGDNINKLGNMIFNTNNDNSKSILFMECDGCNNFIFIEFNQSTKVITKIGYVELT